MIPLHPIFPDRAEIHPLIIIRSNIPTYQPHLSTQQDRALERAHRPKPAVTKYPTPLLYMLAICPD